MVSCNFVSRLKSSRNPGGPNEWHQIGSTTPAAIATAQDHPVASERSIAPARRLFLPRGLKQAAIKGFHWSLE